MTDKELLELAALAAGIEYDAEASKPHPVSKAFWGLWLVIHGEPSEYQRRNWNPLTDDGDALRLAVKLAMSVEISDYEASTYAYAGNVPRVYAMELWRNDKDAATRRAIVRAAAEVAKAV